MVQYVSPVNPAVYPHLAITLLVIGLFFTAWFFVYPHNIVMLHDPHTHAPTHAHIRVHFTGLIRRLMCS